LGLQQVDTLLATTLRSVVMSVALIGLAGTTGRLNYQALVRANLDASAWLCVVGAGICGVASWLAYFAALKVAAAAPVAALDRLSMPLIFVLGVALLGEKVGWSGWLGLILAVSGTYLIMWDQLSRATT
jgi:transporter family protein